MSIKIIEKKVPSSNGKNMLVGTLYIPDSEIKGYFHIVHGMTEYIGRYDKFMRILAENGYIAFGYDHLGHGRTAKDDSELGFIAEQNGDILLAQDVKAFADEVKKEYGDHPYYLMGHSMGSFVVRMAVQNYITPEKLIIMGTGGPKGIASFGLFLSSTIQKLKGPRYYSKLVKFLAFGSYNSKCEKSEGPHAWLTNDEDVRNAYHNDKYCTFELTISAMHDIITLTYNANREKWFKDVAKKMPILLVSGEDDVVGDYGQGVRICEKKLKKYGANVRAILYPGYRHEILNDSSFEMTVKDIIEFIQ